MPDDLERRIRLSRAARLYYVDGWSQDDIALALSTSRSNVSRLLETARKERIVRFVVDDPLRRHTSLEADLEAAFDLTEALVVAESDPTLVLVGSLGAERLVRALDGASRIAIGWGRTIEAVIDHAVADQPFDIEVVQIGGDLTMAPAASGHELVRRLAGTLGGRHRFMHAPALLDSVETARQLGSDPRIAAELDRARTADVALIGIGLPGIGFAEKAVADSYRGKQTPAAVISARLVGDDGAELDGPLRDQVIAVDLDDLRRIPTVIGVAAGEAKGRAIAAAARGRTLDVLVCDQDAAIAALEERTSHATT
jgi:DNA-binding transcriptional regulator LsrR (DeoR family)